MNITIIVVKMFFFFLNPDAEFRIKNKTIFFKHCINLIICHRKCSPLSLQALKIEELVQQ
ncbi:hypothetical protein N172_10480 [Pantoea dispersa EGD-AAK13]|nr:hypothetical protein N172_10480 [Pantoea dispersa EGD-AAK13]